MLRINLEYLKSRIKYQDTSLTYRTCVGGCSVCGNCGCAVCSACSCGCSCGICGKCKCFENFTSIENLDTIYS